MFEIHPHPKPEPRAKRARKPLRRHTRIRPVNRERKLERYVEAYGDRGAGLKAGERHRVLAAIEIVDVRIEDLAAITADDCAREGFPEMSPADFVAFYRKAARR